MKRMKKCGRIIAKLRAWAQYAEMRQAGRRVVTVRGRVIRRRTPRLKGQLASVMFIGSEEEQLSFFRKARS